MTGMSVRSLHIYPVKSTRGLSVDEVGMQPWGLAGDRRWGVVDSNGQKVPAWRFPALLQVVATPTENGLVLTAPGQPPLPVSEPDSPERVSVGYPRLDSAVPAAAEASQWLSRLLGAQVRLVWLDDPRLRPVSAAHGGQDGESLSLADAGPVLLTSPSSLDQLAEWVAETARSRAEKPPGPLQMARFRPNIVVDSEIPFAEDGWSQVRIGGVRMRAARLCDRCVMTTIDPDDLSRGQEPMRTLARHRRWDGHTWFGLRMIPYEVGQVRVGDPVEVS